MPPQFLLDSSVCIAVLRNQTGIGRLPDPTITGIPVIVAAELWTGVEKGRATHPHQVARLEAFLNFFEVCEFSLDAARHYGEIRAALETAGTPIGPLDLLIAAQARSLSATLVTANAAEFQRVTGLKVRAWKGKS